MGTSALGPGTTVSRARSLGSAPHVAALESPGRGLSCVRGFGVLGASGGDTRWEVRAAGGGWLPWALMLFGLVGGGARPGMAVFMPLSLSPSPAHSSLAPGP